MSEIAINKKKKQAKDREKTAGTKWTISDEHIVKVYDLYKANRISFQQLMDHFPGRTFHALTDKVYFIRGKLGLVGKPKVDPDQTALPFGGQIEAKSKY